MERYQEVVVPFSESVMKNCVKCPRRRSDNYVISGKQYNLVISETMHGS